MPSIYSRVWGHSIECSWPRSHTLRESWHSFLQKPSTVHSFPVRIGSSWIPSHSAVQCWLAWSCVALMQTTTCEFMSSVSLSCLEDCAILVLPDLWLLQSFCFLYHDDPWALWRGVIQMLHLWLSFDQLWFPALTIIMAQRPSLMMSKAALIYTYKDTNLEGSSICPFSRVIVIGSLLGPVSSQSRYSVSHMSFSHGTGLKANHKAIGYPCSIHITTIALMGLSGHHTCPYCSSQHTQLMSKIVGDPGSLQQTA